MEAITLCALPRAGKSALTVPQEAFDLFIDLDLQGLALSSHVDGTLRVARKDGAGAPELSDKDRADIRTWKLHLLALVAYCHEDH